MAVECFVSSVRRLQVTEFSSHFHMMVSVGESVTRLNDYISVFIIFRKNTTKRT